MSYGMTPYEFVRQVYYTQEKVLLDFWPTDDKYKEVIYEANLVLEELQKEEDWTWLRERKILGPVWKACKHGNIPEFELSDDVYKASTLFGDNLRLYDHRHGHLIEDSFVEVPFASVGINDHRQLKEFGLFTETNNPNCRLKALRIGNVITFNRPLASWERHKIAVIDVQRRLKPLHICDEHCTDIDGNPPDYAAGRPCKDIEKVIFTEIPDPSYMVIRTAQYHAEGSPTAQGRIAPLTDRAQKLLSAMRQNDAAITCPDTMDWDTPTYFSAI